VFSRAVCSIIHSIKDALFMGAKRKQNICLLVDVKIHKNKVLVDDKCIKC